MNKRGELALNFSPISQSVAPSFISRKRYSRTCLVYILEGVREIVCVADWAFNYQMREPENHI